MSTVSQFRTGDGTIVDVLDAGAARATEFQAAEKTVKEGLADVNAKVTQAQKDLTDFKATVNPPVAEKVLLYYGYPNAIGESWDVDKAVNIYKDYSICIFGDEYNDPNHDAHADTQLIFNGLKEKAPDTRIVGYVPIGLDPNWPDSNHTMDELKHLVDLWVNMGVDGIFLDEFGFDYHVTRERQNEIVGYCHDHNLFVFANSWSLDYVFSVDSSMVLDWLDNFQPNPNGLAPLVNDKDYYLFENLFYTATVVDSWNDGDYVIDIPNPTEDEVGKKIKLECSSVWRMDEVMNYYTNPEIGGKSYYEIYHTKLCSLDAIPSGMGLTQKNVLQSISVIGAAILNINAIAFGDENWGAAGYYHHWDLPSLELGTNGLNGVTVGIKPYQNEDGEESSFPYKWSASINGHTYAIQFDVADPSDTTWKAGKIKATINDILIENAWATIFDFQTDVRNAIETSANAVFEAAAVKKQVEDVMPTLTTAEENIKAVVAEAQGKIEEATSTLEAGLADLATVTAGFGYKEVQW